MKFIVSEEFFEKVPNAYFGIVYFNNFDNKTKLDFTDKMLEEAIESARERLGEGRVKENPLIIPYREAFKNLGINPNTVKKSYDILENKGIITTISTKGTFIADDTKKATNDKIEKEINIIRDKINELTKMGIGYDEIIERIKK